MSEDPRGFTRRTLVRGTLVSAIAASARVKASTPEGDAIGPGAAPLELDVNGAMHRISVEPRVTGACAEPSTSIEKICHAPRRLVWNMR